MTGGYWVAGGRKYEGGRDVGVGGRIWEAQWFT
jgi:hypothetical protein